jgi:hypothetical protein
MSVNPFKIPLYIEIQPSLQKYLIISTPHVLALSLLIFINNIPLLLLLFLVSTILFSFSYFLRLHCFQSLRRSVTSIQLDSVNNWSVIMATQPEVKAASLMTTSFASNHLIILIYRLDNAHFFHKNHSVIITKDSLSKEKFRILKAKLTIRHLT